MDQIDPIRTLLRRVPALADIVSADEDPLAVAGPPRTLEPGEVLIREGFPGRSAFLVVEGELEVTFRERTLGVVGAGEFVGEMALLVHGPRSATVRALGPACVLVIDAASFATLMHRPAIARHIACSLVERLRRAQEAPNYG